MCAPPISDRAASHGRASGRCSPIHGTPSPPRASSSAAATNTRERAGGLPSWARRATSRVTTAIAAVRWSMSTVPRPHMTSSSICAPKGSRVHLASSTGTTSVCPRSVSGVPELRGSAPSTVTTRDVRPGCGVIRSIDTGRPAKKSSSRSAARSSPPESAVKSLTQPRRTRRPNSSTVCSPSDCVLTMIPFPAGASSRLPCLTPRYPHARHFTRPRHEGNFCNDACERRAGS